MTLDDTPDQPKDTRAGTAAAAAELDEFLGSFYRQPGERPPFIDTSKDRFIALILANLQALNNNDAATAAHEIELLALTMQMQFYDLFLARRFVKPGDRTRDILTRLHDLT